MKFIIVSICLHFLIFVSSYTTIVKAKNFEINEVGNTADSNIVSIDFMNSTSKKKESVSNSKKEEKLEKITEKKEKEKEGEKKVVKEKNNEKITRDKQQKLEKLNQDSRVENSSETLDSNQGNKIEKRDNTANMESFANSSSSMIELSKGVFAVKNQGVKGLNFQFLANPEPEYPLVAKRLGYSKDVSVKVRFLVGYNGEIEEAKFYGKEDDLGFQEEVKSTLKKWKLTPITLHGVPVKLYFYKEFKFNKI
ncbi:MAG: energy transducer TonB [Fusobacteriaceae bacterium]